MKEQDSITEYGVSLSVAGALRYCAAPRLRNDKLQDAGHYVGACRRFAARRGISLGDHDDRGDGRLIAVGYNHQSPRDWLATDGGYAKFLAYYKRAADRPDRPNSPYNLSIAEIAACWRLRVPAKVVAAYGRLAEIAPALTSGDIGFFRLVSAMADVSKAPRNIGRGLARRKRAAARIVRALSRVSLRQRVASETLLGDGEHTAYWRSWGGGRSQDWTYERRSRPLQWSPKVLAMFGRLSPEMQEVCIWHTLRVLPDDVRIVMPRHLPWSAIAETHRAMVTHPRVRVAWMAGERLKQHAGGLALAPAYPYIPVVLAARICRGETPVEVSNGQLTRQEAHAWLLAGAPGTPCEWLCRQLPGYPALRDAVVARWATAVHARGQWEQLTRTRKIAGPHGQRIEIRYIDRIDEIMVEDLADGPSTTVAAAFEAAAMRAGEAHQNRLLGDHRALCRTPSHWRPYRCIRILRTPAQLAAEGQEMGHCVGTYVSAVESGKSIIAALSVCGHRSTAELTPDGRVLQHRAHRNGEPHELCTRALARFLEYRI